MKPVYSFFILIVVLCGSLIVLMHGETDDKADLSSIMELTADSKQIATRPVMIATRVSDEEEQKLGNKLANRIYRPSARHRTEKYEQKLNYIQDVGNLLTKFVKRKNINYNFYLIESPMVNAFALPGGHIFIFSGLLEFAQSEAELAYVLGHEIIHVDERHCIELFQAEIAAEKITKPILGRGSIAPKILVGIASRMLIRGYSQSQEFEADQKGLNLAAKAGYNPYAAVKMIERFAKKHDRKKPQNEKHETPVHEISNAIRGAMRDYFKSHPPASERATRLKAQAKSIISNDQTYYSGKKNINNLIAKSVKRYENETVNHTDL